MRDQRRGPARAAGGGEGGRKDGGTAPTRRTARAAIVEAGEERQVRRNRFRPMERSRDAYAISSAVKLQLLVQAPSDSGVQTYPALLTGTTDTKVIGAIRPTVCRTYAKNTKLSFARNGLAKSEDSSYFSEDTFRSSRRPKKTSLPTNAER
ncbi:hypothetical protein KM043_006062 [Ampulex compressa]|nr:hypothetical protein KM043_006062 [Ampulex compressa]